jgi:hypothetical protein
MSTDDTSPPALVVADKPAQWPRYELKFIMRVLGHKGGAPREDWETAYGMAKDILLSLPAAPTPPEPAPVAAEPTERPWPNGCIKPNSCARHRNCMYGCDQHRARPWRDLERQIRTACAAPTPTKPAPEKET